VGFATSSEVMQAQYAQVRRGKGSWDSLRIIALHRISGE
jgi:hypothetical protein